MNKERPTPTVRGVHHQAMALCDEASAAQRAGDEALCLEKTRAAYLLERQAADMVNGDLELEPTRSVLHRSAATLALRCGDAMGAMELVDRALLGHPPLEIAYELIQLLNKIAIKRGEQHAAHTEE